MMYGEVGIHVPLDQLNAHTPAYSGGDWHKLKSHLLKVAELAAGFGEPFGAGRFAYLVGLWHDLGKVNPEFQAYLDTVWAGRKLAKGPRHAIWGSALAYELFGRNEFWKEVAVPVAAHHGELEQPGTLEQKVCDFLAGATSSKQMNLMREALRQLPVPSSRLGALSGSGRRDLFIRMVFSCLVDADYLDTEKHFDMHRSVHRGVDEKLQDLWPILEDNQTKLRATATSSSVNDNREHVYQRCIEAAAKPPGVFRLTVPTGGGKTRSSLAFALRHAVEHQVYHRFCRVIIALPYTSIIDQTAREYRSIFGKGLVLEHHSQIEILDDERQDEHQLRQRLAAENWDHPLIVTTTVQLFESLFANRTSRCRKLHNISQSILILDEVQTLPPELLRPTLEVLRALTEDYGLTVLLSSATQPAFEGTTRLAEFQGVKVHEIVPDYEQHFDHLKRVRYERAPQPLTWAEIAALVRKGDRDRIMVVLNSRKDAMALIRELGEVPGLCHLSTLLCGAHRRKVLDRITARLDTRHKHYSPGPVRLVATQVVEAGVDLDFPEVWRAMGPLERIVQAAGRCNREGRLEGKDARPQLGRVVIFDPAEGRMPRGAYKTGFEKARLLLADREPDELHRPDLHREYFRRVHEDADDRRGRRIQEARNNLDFPTIAREYRLIEQSTLPVVVNYEDSFARLDEWRRAPNFAHWRQIQPYIVSLYEYEARGFIADGWMEPMTDNGNLYRWLGDYDELLGIQAELDTADLCGV